MTDFKLTTPVAMIIFNRPETTQPVFEAIRKARPSKLLVVADGARTNREGEQERCEEARRLVLEGVDWECEVKTNIAPQNLGCRGRVSSGLDWVFQEEEEAIILEDDCLPHPGFFRYAQELLERYRHDERIGLISAANFRIKREPPYSYYYSRIHPITGWASWRRVWKHYDLNMSIFPEVRDNGLLADMLGDDFSVKYWTKIFQSAYDGRESTWDYQFTFAVWMQGMVGIIPNYNQVTNIGFGAEATHITDADHPTANVPVEEMPFPMRHPPYMITEKSFEKYVQEHLLNWSLGYRVKRKWNQLRSGAKKH
ncbi:MAG: glycosyltransferase family 2 protein [Candidatus Kapaibacterium sp.]|nr:MAG: glycosyltransferase family 2 protein [Candidatus Kapabacteria bacterium]